MNMNKHLRKLSSTCFDVAPVPVVAAASGFPVALCILVLLLIVAVIWLVRRSRRNK